MTYDSNNNLLDDAPDLLTVDVQNAVEDADVEEPPSGALITAWARLAYQYVAIKASEVTVRLVDAAEMTHLSRQYRGKDSPTNVLSFPFEIDSEISSQLDLNLLGDIVICHSVIVNEARLQNKAIQNHYAHMVTHGILHLCGYDHQDDQSAQKMELCESQILALSGIANPYSENAS